MAQSQLFPTRTSTLFLHAFHFTIIEWTLNSTSAFVSSIYHTIDHFFTFRMKTDRKFFELFQHSPTWIWNQNYLCTYILFADNEIFRCRYGSLDTQIDQIPIVGCIRAKKYPTFRHNSSSNVPNQFLHRPYKRDSLSNLKRIDLLNLYLQTSTAFVSFKFSHLR